MRAVEIPLHPLSARALSSEYGPGPICMSTHDPLFTFLTCSPLRSRISRGGDVLTASATFSVDDRLAMHLQGNAQAIGYALLKLHKQELCKFAAAAVMLNYRGGAKAAIGMWLAANNVDEEEYSLETAYKLWQRHGWKFCGEKNTTFFAHCRGKAAAVLSKKTRIVPTPPRALSGTVQTLSQIEAELAAQRFAAAIKSCFRRPYKHLPVQARIYYYVERAGLSSRQAAQMLSLPQTSIAYAVRSIRRKAAHNLTLAKLLNSALPDVGPLPAPSVHDSSSKRLRKGLLQNAGFPDPNRSDRPRRLVQSA